MRRVAERLGVQSIYYRIEREARGISSEVKVKGSIYYRIESREYQERC